MKKKVCLSILIAMGLWICFASDALALEKVGKPTSSNNSYSTLTDRGRLKDALSLSISWSLDYDMDYEAIADVPFVMVEKDSKGNLTYTPSQALSLTYSWKAYAYFYDLAEPDQQILAEEIIDYHLAHAKTPMTRKTFADTIEAYRQALSDLRSDATIDEVLAISEKYGMPVYTVIGSDEPVLEKGGVQYGLNNPFDPMQLFMIDPESDTIQELMRREVTNDKGSLKCYLLYDQDAGDQAGKNALGFSTEGEFAYYKVYNSNGVEVASYRDWLKDPKSGSEGEVICADGLTSGEYTIVIKPFFAEERSTKVSVTNEKAGTAYLEIPLNSSTTHYHEKGELEITDEDGNPVTGVKLTALNGNGDEVEVYEASEGIYKYFIEYIDEDHDEVTLRVDVVPSGYSKTFTYFRYSSSPTKSQASVGEDLTFLVHFWKTGCHYCMILSPAGQDDQTTEAKLVPIYRLYLPLTGEHLYTSDYNEYRTLYKQYGWGDEGVAWYSPSEDTSGVVGIYRLYQPGLKNHLYTTDLNEIKVLTSKYGWKEDNGGKPLYYSGGTVPIYRLYNKGLSGMHHLTTDANEYRVLPTYGWKQEGIKFYAAKIGEPYAKTLFYK